MDGLYCSKNFDNDTEKARLVADGLAEILELDADSVHEQTQKNTAYEKVKSKIEQPEADKVREFVTENKVGSIVGLESSIKRYYPNGSMASTVLGFVGDDNQGLSGIEYQYDSELEGVPASLLRPKMLRAEICLLTMRPWLRPRRAVRLSSP